MRRKTRMLAAATVGAGLLVAGVAVVTSGAKQPAVPAQQSPVNTAKVERRELSATVSEPGTLTYEALADGSPYSLINRSRGVYTKLPAAGHVITQGHVIYRVNDLPVVLLQGATPAYRTLAVGASGPDVTELNADLVALGYAAAAQLSPKSASFGPTTTAAVQKLQAALGITQNGMLTLGQVVFEPSAVRVTNLSAQLGGSAQVGETVMQGTSTRRQVQVALNASEQTTMAVGDKVSISLPDNRTTPGVVSSVGAVATCPPSSGPEGPGSSSSAPGTDACPSANSGAGAPPTITVGVTPTDAAATGKWDHAAVQVGITTATVPNALVVPVNALLAQVGSYAVEVVERGARNHLVRVSLGLFDDASGLVQVTATGLAAGQSVVIPTS